MTFKPEFSDDARGHDPLKEIAGRLSRLSYRDMHKLAALFDGLNGEHRSTADRLLAVADSLLEPAARQPPGVTKRALGIL